MYNTVFLMQVGLLVEPHCVIIPFGTSNHCVPLKQDVDLHAEHWYITSLGAGLI